MSDATDSEDIDEIRAEKLEALQSKAIDADEPIHVRGQGEFQDVLAEHPLVLVDFYADWCGPCQMIEPVVEKLAADTVATVAKVDVDENQALAQQHGVRGIPALMIVRDGDVVEQLTGVKQEEELRALIEQYAPNTGD